MPLRSVVYISRASDDLTQAKLHALAASAAAFNKLAGVTGALLTDGARFFQYFEGPPDGLDAVYGRVKSSRSHSGLKEIAQAVVSSRQLPLWEMHAVAVGGQDLDRLITARWEGEHAGSAPGAEDGMSVIAELLSLPRTYNSR